MSQSQALIKEFLKTPQLLTFGLSLSTFNFQFSTFGLSLSTFTFQFSTTKAFIMRKIILIATAVFLFTACLQEQKTNIILDNPSDFDRVNEMVEVDISGLELDFAGKSYVLTGQNGTEVAYQALKKNGNVYAIIFQANIKANSSFSYTITEGVPAEIAPRTFARYVPERKDDFAWENDIAAYRMYGPALRRENPSNGVDLWLKRTDELIVDKFYNDELNNKRSYHIDHGQGLDCYKVGHTLGAGGIAPYTSQLLVGDHYNTQELIFSGPLRSEFKLTYDTVKIDGAIYKQTITITTDAGSIMNKAVVKYEGNDMPLKLAAGIFLHDGKGVKLEDAKNGLIGYAEDAVSEIEGLPSGRNYVGVYIPGASDIRLEGDHFFILKDYRLGHEFTYYFGGGWSKWKFPNDEDWFAELNRFAGIKREPLKVIIERN